MQMFRLGNGDGKLLFERQLQFGFRANLSGSIRRVTITGVPQVQLAIRPAGDTRP